MIVINLPHHCKPLPEDSNAIRADKVTESEGELAEHRGGSSDRLASPQHGTF